MSLKRPSYFFRIVFLVLQNKQENRISCCKLLTNQKDLGIKAKQSWWTDISILAESFSKAKWKYNTVYWCNKRVKRKESISARQDFSMLSKFSVLTGLYESLLTWGKVDTSFLLHSSYSTPQSLGWIYLCWTFPWQRRRHLWSRTL